MVAIFAVSLLLYRAYHVRKTSKAPPSVSSISVREGSIRDVIKDIPAQNRDSEEILFLTPVSNSTVKAYTVSINGKHLNELFTLNKDQFKNTFLEGNLYEAVAFVRPTVTDQATISSIKNNLSEFKRMLLNYLIFAFSKNFFAYSVPIEKSDVSPNPMPKANAKDVFIYNAKTGKTIRIDKMLKDKLPSSAFLKDGDLWVNSVSFSHDGKFLFVSFYGNGLAVFSMEQMKFTRIFNDIKEPPSYFVDMVGNKIYSVAGTDSSNVFVFDTVTKETKALTNCPEASYAISPDN